MSRRLAVLFVLSIPTWLGAQTAAVPAAPAAEITDERVRDAVTWLSADERRGRDTGSPELAEAADWLADRFHKAGLRQVREGSWFHEFQLPGLRIDSGAVQLVLTRKVGDVSEDFELIAGEQVRQLLPSDPLSGDEECTVALADDPAVERLLTMSSARRPVIIEVPEDHVYWRRSEGVHEVLSRRRQAARPVLLVKQGVLPRPVAGAGAPIWTAKWQVAAPERADVDQHNVVAMLAAREDSDKQGEYIVVSAHYDHIGVGREVNGDGIYNGADDDASGTTAVLLIAEALAMQPAPRRNILFVCFAAEERGLLGSRGFVERPPVPIEGIVANLNIEMIGRPLPENVGKAWITGEGFSDFASICATALEKSGVGLVDFEMADRLFAASDNFSFVKHGIVAHSVSAGSLHADYHRPSDQVEKLDIAHMTRIVRGLCDVTVELANRDDAPQWNDTGKARLEKLRR